MFQKARLFPLHMQCGDLPGNSIDRAGAFKLKAQVTQLAAGANPLLRDTRSQVEFSVLIS